MGSEMCIRDRNGCGKTTLLKIINGIVKPDNGTIEIGQTIRIGYFSQENEYMDASMKVIDYVKEVGEYVTTSDGKITASQMLERFLFTPDMQYAPIGKLSGGEKRRLYLLGVLQQGPNVLVMDEVTNELTHDLAQAPALGGLDNSHLSSLNSYAQVIRSGADAIVQVLNGKYENDFIFNGSETGEAPFAIQEDQSQNPPVDVLTLSLIHI